MADQQDPPPIEVRPRPEPRPAPPDAPAPGQQVGDTPRPSLRQRIDEHPVGLFVGVFLAAITATLAIVVPLAQLTMDNRVSALEVQMEQERMAHAAVVQDLREEIEDVRREAAQALSEEQVRAQARIEELDRSLSSIKRSLGSDTEYFDVAGLLVKPGDAASLPETSAYFPADRFYALDVEQAEGWSYQVTTELGVMADLLGKTEEELRAIATEKEIEFMTRIPVHQWRLGDDREISYRDAATGQVIEVHPRTEVQLQRVSHEEYLSVIAMNAGEDTPTMAAIRAGFGRDPAGWVLQDQLLTEISSSGGLRARIDSLQKRDRLGYARVETTFTDVTLGDAQLSEYYWTREWLLIATDKDLYLIKLFVSDDDHRSPDYGALGAWLDAFRVLDG